MSEQIQNRPIPGREHLTASVKEFHRGQPNPPPLPSPSPSRIPQLAENRIQNLARKLEQRAMDLADLAWELSRLTPKSDRLLNEILAANDPFPKQ